MHTLTFFQILHLDLLSLKAIQEHPMVLAPAVVRRCHDGLHEHMHYEEEYVFARNKSILAEQLVGEVGNGGLDLCVLQIGKLHRDQDLTRCSRNRRTVVRLKAAKTPHMSRPRRAM